MKQFTINICMPMGFKQEIYKYHFLLNRLLINGYFKNEKNK